MKVCSQSTVWDGFGEKTNRGGLASGMNRGMNHRKNISDRAPGQRDTMFKNLHDTRVSDEVKLLFLVMLTIVIVSAS